jgi:hypothetical protein
MKTRFGMFLAGLAIAVVTFGVLSPVGSAAAEEPATAGEIDAAYFYGEDAAMPPWGRYSIVYCAAQTMGIEVDAVKMGLRDGHSLKEIGIRAGVRPVTLENGILRCEHSLLERLVAAGELEPHEARRIMNFLSSHITRIINYHWSGAS